MRGITDIHSHIMFQVDDGADSVETSIELLEQEYKQGVTRVILTPHYIASHNPVKASFIKERFEQLKDVINEKIPEMKLYLGNEILWCSDAVELLDNGSIFTLADSRYVLVEFYPSVQYSAMERAINLFLNGGYIPIIAHCERYSCLRTTFKVINYNNISHLVEMGAYMQVNVTSVFGRDSKFVSKLIDNDFLHFVASDAHNKITRGIHWNQCIEYLKKKYNEQYIDWLLVENPDKILNGQYIEA
jgi:protein-tyrosine phosphatase